MGACEKKRRHWIVVPRDICLKLARNYASLNADVAATGGGCILSGISQASKRYTYRTTMRENL